MFTKIVLTNVFYESLVHDRLISFAIFVSQSNSFQIHRLIVMHIHVELFDSNDRGGEGVEAQNVWNIV